MSPSRPNEGGAGPQMDPAILIFLLYLMILHELVNGWMEYQKQIARPKKQSRPLWSASSSIPGNNSSLPQLLAYPTRTERTKDWRKPGRIIRKM